MQICTDHWTARIIMDIKDPMRMGRWAGHQYRLREGKTLTVTTAYRPFQQSPSEACTTSNYQQRLLYRKEMGKKVDPRTLFMADLTAAIKKIENDPKNMVVLMWYANESINDQSGAIRKLITETTLVDAFAQVAGDPGKLTTYTRGKKRLDYILKSQALVPYITWVGYLAFYESNHSDHRGLFRKHIRYKSNITSPNQKAHRI
jgi:exonuclease III